MWWGHPGFHPFFMIFPAILIILLVTRIFFFRRYGCRHGYGYGYGYDEGRGEAEAILRRRLANSEITEEEYQRLKGILTK